MKLHTNVCILINLVLLLSVFESSKTDSVSFDGKLLPVCPIVNCVQGTCRESDTAVLGFECDCYPGWSKYQLGSVVFPPCIIPNCTLNTACGTGNHPPPSPSPSRPPFNIFDPCTYNWCGDSSDGSCKKIVSGFECDCNDGSDNLFNVSTLPCFKDCALGVNCNGVTLGKPSANSPPPSEQTSPSNGLRELRSHSKMEDNLKILLILVAIFHRWI